MPRSWARCVNCWVNMLDRGKLQSAMLALTVASSALFFPPLVYVFDRPVNRFGVPQIILYLFGAWLLMIVLTALLTRKLPPEPTSEVDEGEG